MAPPPRRTASTTSNMRFPRVLRRTGLAVLRLLPRVLHTESQRAALRAAALPRDQRALLARNLAAMLRPKLG